MPTTSPRVTFGLYDLALKADSTLSCPDLQPFAKLQDLRTASATYRVYASYEPDFWLLDGQYKFLPSNYTTVHVGLMSLSMSGADGLFAAPPVLTVDFAHAQETDSLALRFSPTTGDYATALTVAFYNSANALIRTDDYSPGGVEFSTGQAVAGFRRIVITFRATSRPYRYMRLTGLDYGELIVFTGAHIQAANVVEEVNQLSDELPAGALDLTLYSADADFSMLNPAGQYAALKEGLPLDVYEYVDLARLFIGTFYLEEWKNLSDTQYQFHAVDLLAILDRVTYRGGLWAGIALDDLLETILGAVAVPYELDSQLMGTVVRGWLPSGTIRQALQQIGFAVGASITCARSGYLRIQQTQLATNLVITEALCRATITKAQKGRSQELTMSQIVTGVTVTAHNYQAGGEAKVIVSGQYPAGTYEIQFSEPTHALTVSGATVIERGVNYAILRVDALTTVTLSGLAYVDTTTTAAVTLPNLPAGVRANVLRVEDATVVSTDNAAAVAQRVFDYHQQRYRQTVTLYAPEVEPGAVVLVETLYGKQMKGVIESMESDLAKGFVSKVEITGVEYVS